MQRLSERQKGQRDRPRECYADGFSLRQRSQVP
jgi:hypothetical protein